MSIINISLDGVKSIEFNNENLTQLDELLGESAIVYLTSAGKTLSRPFICKAIHCGLTEPIPYNEVIKLTPTGLKKYGELGRIVVDALKAAYEMGVDEDEDEEEGKGKGGKKKPAKK